MTRAHPLAPRTAAGSVLVRDLLAGPVRPASVVATGAVAAYLDVGGRLLAVVEPRGVHLPCAVVLTGHGSPGAPGLLGAGRVGGVSAPDGPATVDGVGSLDVGTGRSGGSVPAVGGGSLDRATGRSGGSDLAVGGGAIHCQGHPTVVVTRWFEPRVRVRRVDPVDLDRLAAVVRSRRRPDALLPTDAAERLADELGRGDATAAARTLLGRGTGLTPAGDDLLAGVLAALRAAGSPAADDLGTAVRALAPVRTSRLSAALLDAADLGAVVPEAAAVLRATAPAPARRDRGVALEAAVDRLVGVGHTTGWHLTAGLLVGLAHAGRAAATTAATASRRSSGPPGSLVRSPP